MPGDERLVPEQVLQLARVAPDPRRARPRGSAPGRPRPGPASASRPGTRPVDAGRQQVDLAHLGRVAVADLRRLRRRPAASRRRAVQAAASGGPPARGPNREDDRRLRRQLLAGCGQLEAAGEHRVDDDPVAIQVDEQELAASRGSARPAARRARRARRACPRTASGPGASARPNRPSAEGGMERLGDDCEVGQFGHGRPIVAARSACARLSRPREAGQLKSDPSGHSSAKERTAGADRPRTT